MRGKSIFLSQQDVKTDTFIQVRVVLGLTNDNCDIEYADYPIEKKREQITSL